LVGKALMAHIDDIGFCRKEVSMSIAFIHSILAAMRRAARILIREHARKRRNAMAVQHLAALPAYLRQDVGLREDVDIVDVVEHGIRQRAADEGTRRTFAILPHAI
jgi:hypothetical protein